MAKEMTVEDKISAAKTRLIMRYPFIGSLLYNSHVFADENCGTAYTDGKVIGYDPKFVARRTVEEVMFLLAHEAMHIAFMHTLPLRNSNKNPEQWNVAGDIIINQILTEDGIGKMIKGGLLDKDLYEEGKQTTDGVYAIIEKKKEEQKQKQQQQSGDGGGQDNSSGQQGEKDWNNLKGHDTLKAPPANINPEQMANDIKVHIAQAAQAAKMSGKMTAGIKRFVDGILNAKVDWRNVLQTFTSKCKDDTRTWARMNRRFISQKIYVPSVDGEGMDDIAVAIDCSGSVCDKELQQFAGELAAISGILQPKNIHVLYFDSEVAHYDVFPRGDEPVLSAHGGGGTAFSPVFKYIEEHEIDPCCCVFLTDLYCGDFGDAPEYPVLWVSTGAEEAPFGEVTKIRID